MSAKSESLIKIKRWAREMSLKETVAETRLAKGVYGLRKCFYLLAHEFIKDDVRVRAESMAYLMIFSLLPLIAGFFFLLSVFSKVGLVQQAIDSMTGNFLEQIPEMHRDYVASYVFRFRDVYLESLFQQSSTLGIFAFSFLAWVGLKVYSNIDSTLNHIWSSDRKRPFTEKVRNFIVVSAIAPIVVIAGVSLPLVIKQLALKIAMMTKIATAFAVFNSVVPSGLIFITLLAMYRYLPVERVKWKSAIWGAAAATLALELTNVAIQFYFRFGTQTAYGKAAIIPILGLWAYFVWLVVILGAEVSYLVSHGIEVLGAEGWSPSWVECRGITRMLAEAQKAFELGEGPLRVVALQSVSGLDSEKLKITLGLLLKKRWLVQCLVSDDPEGEYYSVVRDLSQMPMNEILFTLFEGSLTQIPQQPRGLWEQSLDWWLQFFKDKKLQNL